MPVAAITAADGAAIFAGLPGASTLTWTDQLKVTPMPTAGLISDFSSFGTDAELNLKPDIGAPGGQIYSTWPHQQFGGHNTLGGTSMAAPHVAGLAALILQAKNKDIAASQVRTLLMTGAGLPTTAEAGNGAPNPREFQLFWGRWLSEGVNGVHYFQNWGEIAWNPEVLKVFASDPKLTTAEAGSAVVPS